IITVALLFFVGFVVITYLNRGVDTEADRLSVKDVLLYRSINTSKDLGKTSLDIFDEEVAEGNLIERIDDNRWYIYQNAISNLADRPEYWLYGAGFQNASRAIGGIALA